MRRHGTTVLAGFSMLALLALLVPRALYADPLQHPECPNDPTACTRREPKPAPLPPCWPSNFGGTGTQLASGMTSDGTWHGWWCPVGGDWKGVGFVSVNGWLVRHPHVLQGSITDIAAEYWKLNVMDPATPELEAVKRKMWSTLAPYKPRTKN